MTLSQRIAAAGLTLWVFILGSRAAFPEGLPLWTAFILGILCAAAWLPIGDHEEHDW